MKNETHIFEQQYYVYAALKDEIVMYIGKGTGNRVDSAKNTAFEAYDAFAKCDRRIVAAGMTERQALTLEAQLIKEYDPKFNIACGLGEDKWVGIPAERFVHAGALARTEVRKDGTINTPDAVAQQIVDELPWEPKDGAFWDPMCLDASFGRAAIRKAMQHHYSNSWIEENILMSDISIKAVARAVEAVEREFPSLNVDKMVKLIDITKKEQWPMKQFKVAVANPPWNIKEGGKIVKYHLWRDFANLLLDAAEHVVIVAPMAARQQGKRVLIPSIRFDGNDGEGCAVVWSEDAARDFSEFPKFDLWFSQLGCGKTVVAANRKKQNTSVAITNWKGDPFFCTPGQAKTNGLGKFKLMMRFRSNGQHDAAYGPELFAMCYVIHGEESELRRWEAYSRTEEGVVAIRQIANNADVGFIGPKFKDLNAAFSIHHKEK